VVVSGRSVRTADALKAVIGSNLESTLTLHGEFGRHDCD
jgi:hypothetical protein